MADWYDIQYREFYDVPRVIIASKGNETFLFDCRLDDTMYDYPNDYRVYRMPPLSTDQLAGSWVSLEQLAIEELDRIPIRELPFEIER